MLFMVKRDHPNISVYLAWDKFCEKLIEAGAFENEEQIRTAWLYAFREPAIRQFSQLYRGERIGEVVGSTLGFGSENP